MSADQRSSTEPLKNIVLVGRTGNGKSATGNTLMGDKQFISKKRAGGVTMKRQMLRAATQDGPIINVIDTHGLCDLAVSAEYISEEIVNCLRMAEEGIHAVLFVLSTRSRISEEEESTLYTLQRIFERKILDYFIVVFTGGDTLEDEGQTLDDYLRDSCPEFLSRILRLCGQRKVLFDNKTKDKEKKAAQLKELLAHIADVEQQTGGKPYTDNTHRKIKEENDKLREQEREIEAKNLAEEESKVMQEKLKLEHEKNMKIMAEAVEKALNQTAEAHEKEMRLIQDTIAREREIQQMKDEFQQNQKRQLAEDVLKENAANAAHEKEIIQKREEFQQNRRRQLVLKQNAAYAAHEKEILQKREEFQQNQLRQLAEDVLKQNAAAEEKEIHQMREEFQQFQQNQMPPNLFPKLGPVECNIM